MVQNAAHGRRLRLLFAIHSPVLGGAAQTLLTLRDALAARHDVGLLWSGAEFDAGGLAQERSPIFTLDMTGYSKSRPLRYLGLIRHFRRITVAFRPDIVLSRGFMAARALGWPCRLLGIPSLAYLADSWPMTSLTRFMLSGNRVIAGVSRSTVVPIRASGRRIVIPPGFRLDEPDTGTGMATDGAGRVRIGTVGELVPWKGHRHLIAAFALLGDLRDRAELVIVGDDRLQPGYREELAALARSLGVAAAVRFAGFQDPVRPWYERFDLFVLPTEANEAFGRVLAEAALAGLPLIGTRSGGIPEIIEDGVNGLLVPPKDPPALARAIARLAGDARLRSEMGSRAKSLARERYGIDVIAGRFEQLFAALAGRDRQELGRLCF
jgi:glycosyltransferase involved in cell wall biosynthesis